MEKKNSLSFNEPYIHGLLMKLYMQDATVENKLRLLMIYASVYPEKFEGDKALKLMQVTAGSFVTFLFSMMDLYPTALLHEFNSRIEEQE